MITRLHERDCALGAGGKRAAFSQILGEGINSCRRQY
jgi:hypothetical protein